MLSDWERAALAARLRQGRKNTGELSPGSRIARRPAWLADLPLSFGQEQLWFIDGFAPGLATYNIPLALALSGPLNPAALGRAIDALAARHEALRTRLVTGAGGAPVQVIDPPAARPLEVVDLAALEPEKRRIRLREFIDTEAVRPFSLACEPLLRTWLLRLAGDEHVLLVVVHHAVFDGWSARLLVTELAALYGQEDGGELAGLAELPVQFADYARWERDRLQGAELARLADYWRGALAGLPTVAFPTDRPRPVVDSFEGALAQHLTDRELLDGLRAVSRQAGTTLFVTLLAGLQALLHRYTGQTDLVVGTVSASRTRPELAPLIGFLVNTLPMRADLSGDPTFTELLARVREATVGAYAHQDLPFAKLVETLGVERDPGRAPVFQIALIYAERDNASVRAAGVDFSLTDLVVGINAAKFDLEILAEARADGLWFECSYKTRLFDPATITRLLGNLEVLLRGVAADPSARLSALPVLTEGELRRELAEWNDTAAALPVECVHQGFQAQVRRTPDAIAAEFGDQQLSYDGLNRLANRIARRLRGLGVGPETLVGVCMQSGLPRLAALLGIWKAGGGYVPLDPDFPAARLTFMITDTAMTVILADHSAAAAVEAATAGAAAGAGAAEPVTVLSLDAGRAEISGLDDTDLDERADPSNVAYVIYTSGSTGQPKGVVVEHRQASNFLQGMVTHWQIGPSSAVLQFAAFTFDVSVLDMFMPLLAGARVVLAPAQTLHAPPRLGALIRDRKITFACLPPAVLALLTGQEFPDLQILVSAGEELGSELARRWVRPGLRLVNGYGPTEATVLATYQELDATMSPPPIGRPVWPNYRAYVLDSSLNPVPVGVTGELHIGGASVARGYLNRPDLTRQRFIADPFVPDPSSTDPSSTDPSSTDPSSTGERLYKTGDLVRRNPDGTITFTGRLDHQVKINGLRIETGEIETALTTHPHVAQAIVTLTATPAGDKQLTAYLRPRAGATPAPADLRTHLARTLPAYMIPSHLITLGEFPLNPSGKVDRAALPPPDQIPAGAEGGTGAGTETGTETSAPATFTETVLTGLYATVLGRERVGATDSFFDIGGSSLPVMRLVDLIHDAIGVDVGVTAVFLHPTPRQLAASIDAVRGGTGKSAGSGPLTELSAGAGELELFLIHPVGGTVFAYAQLARELAGTFKVYGLEAPGLSSTGATAGCLTDLVTDYTERIRAACPDGPYRLAGWSMGGVVAFEVARRLEQAGAEVGMLALLDAPFAVPAADVPAPPQLAGRFLADAARSLGWDAADLPDPATSPAAQQLAWLADRLRADGATTAVEHEARAADAADAVATADAADPAGAADAGLPAGQGSRGGERGADAVAARLRDRFAVFQAHSQMLAGYQPDAPPLRAPTLIVSADDSPNAPARAHWPRVLHGPVSTLRVDGDHYTFLRPPLIADVGASILKWHDAGT